MYVKGEKLTLLIRNLFWIDKPLRWKNVLLNFGINVQFISASYCFLNRRFSYCYTVLYSVSIDI